MKRVIIRDMIEAITRRNSVQEALKFLVTGGTNTLVDFAVLNLLIVIFGLAQGDPKYLYFKALSYIAASTNSYILNKWWVFKNKKESDKKEIGTFVAVSGVGLVLNTLISLSVFHLATTLFPLLNAHISANIGAISGTLLVLIFNFLSYKFIVFKK